MTAAATWTTLAEHHVAEFYGLHGGTRLPPTSRLLRHFSVPVVILT
jgi:hypothetical protein